MDIENTPEFQEHRLKVESIRWVENQIQLLKRSLVTDKVELADLATKLGVLCEQNGHDYNKDYLVKDWVTKMVAGSYPSLSPMDGYDSDYEPPEVDEGYYKHSVHKVCKGCGYVHKREAVINYS